jgi:division protein CdvB (Snf7/Vps24/ESCRT-III family)
MMMKSMGFDPAKIQQVLAEAKIEIETRIKALEDGQQNVAIECAEVARVLLQVDGKLNLLLDHIGLDAAKSRAHYDASHLALLSPQEPRITEVANVG